MTSGNNAGQEFRALLMQLASQNVVSDIAASQDLTGRFRQALLIFSSHSDDNVACAEELDIGTFSQMEGTVEAGVRIRALGRLVSNVLWNAEGCPVPTQLREAIPEITQQQWDASLRFATLLMTAFECSVFD